MICTLALVVAPTSFILRSRRRSRAQKTAMVFAFSLNTLGLAVSIGYAVVKLVIFPRYSVDELSTWRAGVDMAFSHLEVSLWFDI